MKPKLLTKELTSEQKQRLNAIYRMLIPGTTKEEISATFDISERQARDYVSYIKKVKPVIATSAMKGYKIARTMADLELAKQTAREIKSRIEDLNESYKPLIKFIEKAERYEQQ